MKKLILLLMLITFTRSNSEINLNSVIGWTSVALSSIILPVSAYNAFNKYQENQIIASLLCSMETALSIFLVSCGWLLKNEKSSSNFCKNHVLKALGISFIIAGLCAINNGKSYHCEGDVCSLTRK